MLKKCCRIGKDLLSILRNLKIIDFLHLMPFIKKKYFKFSGCTKEQKSLYFFEVNYLLFKQNFVFDTLLEYWNIKRCFLDISNLIGVTKPNFKHKNILDIGCGYTSILNLLQNSNRYGVDIIISSLNKKFLNLNKNINWINGNGENLPFNDDSFDIIFCSNALDHFENPWKVIFEIKRVLKDNGLFILIIDVFDREIGYRNIKHPFSFTEKKVLKDLKDFEILFQKYGSDKKIGFSKFLWDKINVKINRINNKNIMSHESEKKELILVLQVK